MIKVIFFDVDDTLFSHSCKRMPQSTIYALDRLKEKGILRVVATGRSLMELKEINLGYFDFDAYILLNGQMILDHDLHLIEGSPIPDQDFKYLLELYNTNQIPLQFIEEDRYYINFVNDDVKRAQEAIHTSIPPVLPYSGKPIYQICSFIDEADIAQLEKRLTDCIITRWSHKAIDIISKTGGKEKSIQKYLRLKNISQKETMAFGDGDNDQKMLEYCHIGIAMGNAKENVKQIADYITTDIDHTGIYAALKHFELI